ncbi:MAG TPA: BTAD domain-containing putative transcriptional regulator [Candidatus Dormibacteraeota bacterium]
MRGTCAVQLMSAFQVEVDGRLIPASAWRHRRGAQLVKLLALAPAHSLHREELMETLWPELAADAAAANLRKAVHYARQALGGRDAIAADGEMLMLWPTGELRVDAEIAEAESRKALATASGLEAAADLFTGDLLPADRYAGWTEPHRERLRRRRLQVLRAAARWEQVLDLEGTDEEACRELMRRHLELRDRRAAIREFQRLREILRVDLGVAPEPATVALFEEAVAVETAEPPRSAERAQALLARGLMHWSWRELDPAEKLAQAARDLAMEGHLGRELGEASSLLGMVAFARGRWPEHFRQEFTEALRLSTERAPFVLDAHLCLVQGFLTTADRKTVTGLARELLDAAVDAGSVPGEAAMSLLMGESQLFAGNLDEAREWLSRAAGMYEDLDGASGRAFSLVRLAEVANADGRQAEATRQLIVARALADRSELVSHLLPRVFEAMIRTAGNAERRRRVLSDAGGAMRPKEVCGPCSIGLRVAATIACARSGDRAQARKWLTDAERIASMWQGTAWEAAVWEARAELRRAEGDDAQAKALLREAAELFAERGRPLDEARCLAGIG